MIPRYRPLALYSLVLALVTGAWLAIELAGVAAYPPVLGRGGRRHLERDAH